jgi:hypothetical protein
MSEDWEFIHPGIAEEFAAKLKKLRPGWSTIDGVTYTKDAPPTPDDPEDLVFETAAGEEAMTETQFKKLVEYVKELAKQHNELEAKEKALERRIAELEGEQ